MAAVYEEAKNQLLFVATLFCSLVVVYELVALWKDQVNWLALGDAAFGLALVIFGIMAMRLPGDTAS